MLNILKKLGFFREKRRTEFKLYTAYSNAVAKNGPLCDDAIRLRDENEYDPDFIKFANAIDDLKIAVGNRT